MPRTSSPTQDPNGTPRVLDLLQRFESRNITHIDRAAGWPIVWARARGCHVWDAENRRYLDLTAAFGVAAAGHGARAVVQTATRQASRLLHAMGDVHPHALKAHLLKELSALTFERWGAGPARTVLGNSGFEAVEAALKTARLATGRREVIAFEGAYHGLGYGTLNVTQRGLFRDPFRDQLREFGRFLPFPQAPSEDPASGVSTLRRLEAALRRRLRGGRVGAILTEPVQARGGIRVPPSGFLQLLRNLCDEYGALLILDEIYTGFGRTGRWFACEHDAVVPDLLCVGKALTGGFPLSACVGRGQVMESAWPPSHGEAWHTSTFLGHPVGCAMALAQIKTLRELRLPERAANEGAFLLRSLNEIATATRRYRASARGLGLMAGLELHTRRGNRPAGAASIRLVQRLLHRGFILLPEGYQGEVVGFTPPLIIRRADLQRATSALQEELDRP